MNFQPVISVCIFSYNYEKYIENAIESVLKQRLNVPIEIIIGDDYSSDRTPEIISQYQQQHPSIIFPSFNNENMGGTRNWINTINLCRGKYIALLDGDDYFTDLSKLQKQYNALENDINAVLCFHAVEEKYENVQGKDTVVRFEKQIYTIEDFLSRGWFIRTASTFFRNHLLPKNPPEWVYNFPYRYDTIMHVFLGTKGYAIYIDDPMSVWRKHLKGMSIQLMENMNKNLLTEISMARKLDEHTNHLYSKLVKKNISKLYSSLFFNLLKTGISKFNILIFFESITNMHWHSSWEKFKHNLFK